MSAEQFFNFLISPFSKGRHRGIYLFVFLFLHKISPDPSLKKLSITHIFNFSPRLAIRQFWTLWNIFLKTFIKVQAESSSAFPLSL